MNKKYVIPICIGLIYFTIGLLQIHDYGINWDSPYNFQRGQAILHYFLSGDKNYSTLSNCNYLQGSSFILKSTLKAQCPQKNGLLRSYYQSNNFDYKFANNLDKKNIGHPTLAGIFAAITNSIFYQRLGIMDDTDSHNLFSLIMSGVMVLIVGIWATQVYGSLAGIISALSLSVYPILFGERNFNFKDIPVASFYLLTIYFFWLAITQKKILLLTVSALFCAISMSIKFNILFAPFILLPYFYSLYIQKNESRSFTLKFSLALLLFPIFSYSIFYSTWPFWWSDPFGLLKNVVGFYTGIGLNIQYQSQNFYILGFNTYPIKYFLFTTPLPIISLLIIGIVFVCYRIKRKENESALVWLLLFFIPLLRVTLPKLSSYGGIRQILEFSPGMALLSGYGAYCFISLFKNMRIRVLILLILFCGYLFTIRSLYLIHPNENLFFNSLIGGIKGAKESEFPGWQESFGNDYYQGIIWLNTNAEKNAKLTYPIQGMHNYVPFSKVRPDIIIDEKNWSDTDKKGEYIIDPNPDSSLSNRYAKQFELKSLTPVYILSVNGTAIGYVYKNDLQHTLQKYRKPIVSLPIHSESHTNSEYIFNVGQVQTITKIQFTYPIACKSKPKGSVFINESGWQQLPEPLDEQYFTLPYFDMGGTQNKLIYYIPYDSTDSVKITFSPYSVSCDFKILEPIISGITS